LPARAGNGKTRAGTQVLDEVWFESFDFTCRFYTGKTSGQPPSFP